MTPYSTSRTRRCEIVADECIALPTSSLLLRFLNAGRRAGVWREFGR